MIEVQGLTKSYGSVAAVRDLSFSVAPGEVLGLVGPNGAGKTTTLRSLAGIGRPAGGTIRERAGQGAAVVLSSHLLHLVEEICTRVLILHRGRKVALGTIEEMLTERPDLRGRSLEDIFLTLTGT